MVVIADRFPQTQIPGFTDGPRLEHWLRHRSRLLRGLAARERAAYRLADVFPPDLVVRLHVTPEVAAKRRPETTPASLTRRVAAIERLSFPPAAQVLEVDATRPLDEVVLEVKHAIWTSL
jgi:hypothetical protein